MLWWKYFCIIVFIIGGDYCPWFWQKISCDSAWWVDFRYGCSFLGESDRLKFFIELSKEGPFRFHDTLPTHKKLTTVDCKKIFDSKKIFFREYNSGLFGYFVTLKGGLVSVKTFKFIQNHRQNCLDSSRRNHEKLAFQNMHFLPSTKTPYNPKKTYVNHTTQSTTLIGKIESLVRIRNLILL